MRRFALLFLCFPFLTDGLGSAAARVGRVCEGGTPSCGNISTRLCTVLLSVLLSYSLPQFSLRIPALRAFLITAANV